MSTYAESLRNVVEQAKDQQICEQLIEKLARENNLEYREVALVLGFQPGRPHVRGHLGKTSNGCR